MKKAKEMGAGDRFSEAVFPYLMYPFLAIIWLRLRMLIGCSGGGTITEPCR